VPRGYPRQEVPVGPGDSIGNVFDHRHTYTSLPRNRSVCSRMLTFLAAIGSGTQWACVPQTSLMALENSQAVICGTVTLRTYYQ